MRLDRRELERLAARLLQEREELARGLPVGFYTGWFEAAAEEFHFDYVSPRASELIGVSTDDLRADWRAMLRWVDPDDAPSLEHEATAVTYPGDEANWVGRVVHDGVERWLHVHSREWVSRPGRWLGIVADITERKHLEIELARLASTDALTDLGNRRLFEERTAFQIERWRRSGGWLALALIDVDNFKHLNDSQGHVAGDRALVDVAGLLRRQGRRSDVIARIGGDEFAVLMPGTDADSARVAMERIAGELAVLRGRHAHLAPLTLSIGIVAVPAEASDVASVDDLVLLADRALYEAKSAGRNRICLASTNLP